MASDQAEHDPEKAGKQAGNSLPAITGSCIISYNLREEERPAGIMVRWKWRVETGRKAQVLDARQAEVIRRILQWQYDRKHDPDRAGPAEPVPVAMLGRTSTLELQDPYGSITRQITSAREWLPDGFYLAGYYWDIESGGLDIEQRGRAATTSRSWTRACPRDGGLADLLAEANSPAPRFAAVVCRGHRAVRPGHLQRAETGTRARRPGILLFATDEPVDLDGTDPATILVRRTKQNIAEYFRLSLKRKGLERAARARRPGLQPRQSPRRVPPGEDPAPDPVQGLPGPHQNPAGPGRGARPDRRRRSTPGGPRTSSGSTRSRPAERRPGHLPARRPGHRLDARRPVRDPGQPEIHRVPGVRPPPPGQPVPRRPVVLARPATHPAIVDRDTWEAAQNAGAEHRSSRDGDDPNPPAPAAPTRSGPGPLQGVQAAHVRPDPHPPANAATDDTLLLPVHPATPGTPPPPDHPAPSPPAKTSCWLRCAAWPYALAPGRAAARRTPPGGAADAQARHDAQAAAPAPAQADRRRRTEPDHRTEQRRRHARQGR